MFEIGIVAHFEAAHRLQGDFGPATRVHGHTYRLEVAVRGPGLREDGTLCDLGLLQRRVDEVVAELHYQDLDELPNLRERNTTIEMLARYVFERLAPALGGQQLAELSVRVWESPTAFGAFTASLE